MKVRNSRKTYIPVYFMIVILLFTIGYIKYSGKELNNLALKGAFIFSILAVIITELHRLSNRYEINDNAVVHAKGLFFVTSKRTDILAVSDAELKQNPWQRILNFGDVNVMVFSRESVTNVKNINNPSEFTSFLEDKINEKRGGAQKKGGISH